ncbi:MAG TPA: hypothetical protein VMB80_02955 [Candidatus Acidoferrum sp.]|nr:hypothetical protein [Candidatus Acidoferrum sp.]
MAAEPGRHQVQTTVVTGLSNREFLERFAQPGRVGLCGGSARIDLAIRRAQRRLDAARRWSDWSHAFIFEGTRPDGQHWVIESDILIHRKNIQLGAQENRMAKYYDEKMYPTLAVLDFGLNAEQVATLLRAGLDLVADRERYSLRELVGTLIALRKPELRARENLLAQERSIYCSALVKRLFLAVGLDLTPGIAGKNTTPEDISRSPAPHVRHLLQRAAPGPKAASFKGKIRAAWRAQLNKIKRRRAKSQAGMKLNRHPTQTDL